MVASRRGDPDEAIRLLTRVVEEAADDDWLRSSALGDLASLHMEAGRDEEARHLFVEATRGLRATGDEANDAIVSMNLAGLELYLRDFEAAYVVAASTLEKVRTIGDLYRTIGAWMVLGFAALGLGRRSEAREALAESLDLIVTSDARSDALPETLTGIALAADTAADRLGFLNDAVPADPPPPRAFRRHRLSGRAEGGGDPSRRTDHPRRRCARLHADDPHLPSGPAGDGGDGRAQAGCGNPVLPALRGRSPERAAAGDPGGRNRTARAARRSGFLSQRSRVPLQNA